MKPVAVTIDLSFTYSGADQPALRDVNLELFPGQLLTIVGPSGSGKSTLALCLAGFVPHAFPGRLTGNVRILGKEVVDYPAGGLSGIVGLVQQDPEAQLCTLIVEDEVAFGPENLCLPPAEIKKRVQRALSTVSASHLVRRRVHTLSGGEKQRIAIASMLAMNPRLIILDEPTANLDPRGTREVLQAVLQLKAESDVSVVVIEHRWRQLVDISDTVLQMEGGRIVRRDWPIGDPAGCRLSGSAWTSSGHQTSATENVSRSARDSQHRPLLTVRDLSAGYQGRPVLKDINFSLFPGEIAAVMGDNGSGKTTLLSTLMGFIKPTDGAVEWEGVDITDLQVARRAEDMGFAFQNPNHQLFERTVLQEALLPSQFLSPTQPALIAQRVKHLLQQFELEQYEDINPFCLSLGEKKRLTLISILAYQPALLLLDEPLVGQDDRRLNFLLSALQEHRCRGGAALITCHEPSVVCALCQRILFLKDGQLLVDAGLRTGIRQLQDLGFGDYVGVAPGGGEQADRP